MVKPVYIFLFLVVFLIDKPLFSQSKDNLEQIKEEINQLENELTKSKTELKSEVNTLNKYDKQIDLVNKAVSIMEQSIKKNTNDINILEDSLQIEQTNIDTLKSIIEKQTLLLYLQGITRQDNHWLSLLSGQDDYRKAKYASFLLSYEEKLSESIISKLNNIRTLKEKKSGLLTNLQKTKNDKSKEKSRLAANSKEKKRLIRKIKNDQKLLAQSISEKKESYEQLKKFLVELEKNRTTDKKSATAVQDLPWQQLSGSFSKAKGKLNWPVQGKISNRFGRHQDKKYRIVAVNNGIDIKAKIGTPVRSVHDGKIVKVTYMGGFGNTVILDHNDGYYTVYSHLAEVNIEENSFIKQGETIGTVGDSGSMDGAKLHFEIYAQNKPINPEKWLK